MHQVGLMHFRAGDVPTLEVGAPTYAAGPSPSLGAEFWQRTGTEATSHFAISFGDGNSKLSA
jgi:hypothetical protein